MRRNLDQSKATAANTSHVRSNDQTHISMAVPRFTAVHLVFDLETDPTNDVVFAAGLSLLCTSTRHTSEVLRKWWGHFVKVAENPNPIRATMQPATMAPVIAPEEC